MDNEPDVIAAAAPPPATLLELGCGAGRVTGPLTERGFAQVLQDSGLVLDRYLTPDGTWAGARPRSSRSPMQ